MYDYVVNITQTIGLKQPESNQANNEFEERSSIVRQKSNWYSLSQNFNIRIIDERDLTGNY